MAQLRAALDVARIELAPPEHAAVAPVQADCFQLPIREPGQKDPPAPQARRGVSGGEGRFPHHVRAWPEVRRKIRRAYTQAARPAEPGPAPLGAVAVRQPECAEAD
jgi:hypothetical protein